ncbi:MAG: rhodanese-like domain-containing protein [Bacteriovoracaceae bacterium]|nr:rhodanese-like domain-containing protein [Bacteriovoracaceae bacterium]
MKFFFLICLLMTFSTLAIADCYISKNGCGIHPEFKTYNSDKFMGPAISSPGDPAPGLKYILPSEAIKYIKNPNYVFIDTRPISLFNKCQIRESKNYNYSVPGNSKNTLTKEIVKKFADAGKTMIFYCNALKCYRGLNAAIQSYKWGLPAEKIKWLGKGVPGIVKETKKYRKYVKGKGCSEFK